MHTYFVMVFPKCFTLFTILLKTRGTLNPSLAFTILQHATISICIADSKFTTSCIPPPYELSVSISLLPSTSWVILQKCLSMFPLVVFRWGLCNMFTLLQVFFRGTYSFLLFSYLFFKVCCGISCFFF